MKPITFAGTHRDLSVLKATPVNRQLVVAENAALMLELCDSFSRSAQGKKYSLENVQLSRDAHGIHFSVDKKEVSVMMSLYEDKGRVGSLVIITGDKGLVADADNKLKIKKEIRNQFLSEVPNAHPDELPQYTYMA